MRKRGKRKKVDLAKKLKLPKKNLVFVPASYWKRALAFLIDLLIIDLIVISPFRSIFRKILSEQVTFSTAATFFESNPELLNQITWITIVVSILVISYFSVLQFRLRQTLGMMLFNIWVYSEEKELSSWKVVISNLTFTPVFPFVMLWIIDPIFLLFSPTRQRLMQKFVGIYIVEETQVGYI